jgi:hypothetical protein
VADGQHLPDPRRRVAGQFPGRVRRLAGQVLHLVEQVIKLAGVGIPAVVRVAVASLPGQPGEDVIQFGPQLGGRVGTRTNPGEYRGDRVRAGRRGRAGAVRVQAAGQDPDADLGAVHDRLDLRADRGDPGHPVRQDLRLREHALVHGRPQ